MLLFGILSLKDIIVLNKVVSSAYIIKQDLTRFAIQAKGPDGKWTRKPLAYRKSNNVNLKVKHFVNFW